MEHRSAFNHHIKTEVVEGDAVLSLIYSEPGSAPLLVRKFVIPNRPEVVARKAVDMVEQEFGAAYTPLSGRDGGFSVDFKSGYRLFGTQG